MINITVSVRAIILNKKNQMFLCRQGNKEYWSLPGGHLEFGETTIECLEREMHEEFGVEVIVGDMLFVRELVENLIHRVEFYFSIKNPEVFQDLNLSKIESDMEIIEGRFINLQQIEKSEIKFKPDALCKIFEELLSGNNGEIRTRFLGNVK